METTMSDAVETADDHPHEHPNYVLIWGILLGLMIAQFGVKQLDILPYQLFIGFIFMVATVKTTLVALNFMHMKFENLVIFSLALTPFIFVILFLSVVMFDVPALG